MKLLDYSLMNRMNSVALLSNDGLIITCWGWISLCVDAYERILSLL